MVDQSRTSLDLLSRHGTQDVVIVAEHDTIDLAKYRQAEADFRRLLPQDRKALVMIERPRSSWRRLAAYTATLGAGHAVCFVDEASAERSALLRSAFRPDVVVGNDITIDACDAPPLHRELALLMWTSGSHGEAKAVRLSYRNLEVNARAIAGATDIEVTDRVATSLPLDYTFGLSMVNSHLAAGAGIALTTARPSSERSAYDVATLAATTAGITPGTAAILARRPQWLAASVRHLLVAGGRTAPDVLQTLARRAEAHDAVVHSMYGQTEATARISCLPPELLVDHPDSVGRPIDGCIVRVLDDRGAAVADGATGEIEVSGEQVMLGYAASRNDCARGDDAGGVQLTGDRGRFVDGLLYVSGRLDRTVKIMGRRVDLDGAERLVAGWTGAPCAATATEDRIVVTCEVAAPAADLNARLAAALGVPQTVIRVRFVHSLPMTRSGKIDYPSLRRELEPAMS